jgi:hypothetical protein
MRLHANARTCPNSRKLLVRRIEEEGWSLMAAAGPPASASGAPASGSGAGEQRERQDCWIAAPPPGECRRGFQVTDRWRSRPCGGYG